MHQLDLAVVIWIACDQLHTVVPNCTTLPLHLGRTLTRASSCLLHLVLANFRLPPAVAFPLLSMMAPICCVMAQSMSLRLSLVFCIKTGPLVATSCLVGCVGDKCPMCWTGERAVCHDLQIVACGLVFCVRSRYPVVARPFPRISHRHQCFCVVFDAFNHAICSFGSVASAFSSPIQRANCCR